MLLPQPVRCTTNNRWFKRATASMASHCPSRKRLSSPSIWRNSDSAFALLMTLGDRIGPLAVREIHFKDSFNTNWLGVSMTVFLQAWGYWTAPGVSQTLE